MAIIIDPISPVAFSIFGFGVRWYAIAYVLAFVVGFLAIGKLTQQDNNKLSKKQMDDFITAIILGVLIGGRLGYVLFYNLHYFLAHPLEIFALWHGGMSFHGGLLGVVAATFIFGHNNKLNSWSLLDLLAVVAPIGLFFGRIANFINMEVMGRPSKVPWAVVFNGDTQIPRHPSPLYEAGLEGIVLFIIMLCLYKFTNLRKRPGALAGIMGMLYALFRSFCELFRAPDAQIGFLTSWGLTMGQLLSIILFFAGLLIFAFAFRKK
ncbi:MAG: prolipoprotein diacylglyceryl transferase [Alphaproteobacteria bacterium]|nr:prolipoprotein diacylglyceryl transferase [Alphaproteobacteria bacterium]